MESKVFKSSVAGLALATLFGVTASAEGEVPKNPESYYKTTNEPLIYGPVDIVIPVGEKFDVNNSMFRVFAKDFEDGDLTAKIQKKGHEAIDTSKPGQYTITYTVVDSHKNETKLEVPVKVEKDTNIKIQRKLYSNLKNEGANAVGMSRGDYQDRQHLGLNLFNGSQVKVSYVEGNSAVTIQNETQRHANEPVTSQTIKQDQSIVLTSSYNATPFARTPVGNNLEPTILEFEILDENVTKPLALFHRGDDQAEFISSWQENGGYGVLDSESVTVLVDHDEIGSLKASNVPNVERDFNTFLTWWDDVTDFFDDAVGLKINPENLWDQNVRSKYYVAGHKGAGGSAYYGAAQVGISNGTTAPFFQYNWGGLHEVGHGYQGSLKNGIALGEVSNNILGWYTQNYAMNTTRFGEQKQFYGGLRNGSIDTKEESVHTNRKTWQNYDLNDQLYIMINLLDSFEGEQTWAKINSWYRQHKATNMPNYDVMATVIAKEYKVNIIPYFEAFGIHVSDDVRANLFETDLQLVNMAKDLVGDQTSILKDKGVIKYDYKIVKNDEIASLDLSSNVKVNVKMDDVSLVEGQESILYDGTKVVAKGVVKNGVVEYTDVPVGTYRLAMPVRPAGAYGSDYAYVTVTEQGQEMDYTYTKLDEIKYDNQMWLGISGIHGTYGIKLSHNGNGTVTITPRGAKLANSDAGKIAEVTILNEKNEVVYTTKAENSYYFDKSNEKVSTIEVKDGYKIKLYHVSPTSRVKVFSTLTGGLIKELVPTNQSSIYVVTENGFKLENMTDEQFNALEYENLKSALTKEIDTYLNQVTPEALNNKEKDLVTKNKVLSAIMSLKAEDVTVEYKELYDMILYGHDLTVATNAINQIKDTLKDVLTTEKVDVSQIKEILLTQSAVGGVSETDKNVANKLKAALAGQVNGSFGVHVSNYGANITVDELLQNKLLISYQAPNDTAWYMLQEGKINKQ